MDFSVFPWTRSDFKRRRIKWDLGELEKIKNKGFIKSVIICNLEYSDTFSVAKISSYVSILMENVVKFVNFHPCFKKCGLFVELFDFLNESRCLKQSLTWMSFFRCCSRPEARWHSGFVWSRKERQEKVFRRLAFKIEEIGVVEIVDEWNFWWKNSMRSNLWLWRIWINRSLKCENVNCYVVFFIICLTNLSWKSSAITTLVD